MYRLQFVLPERGGQVINVVDRQVTHFVTVMLCPIYNMAWGQLY